MKIHGMRVLNLALYLAGCAALGTGLLLKYRLPPGSRGGRGLTAMGLDRHDWGDIHFWLAVAVVVLVGVHLMQNRVWLRKIAARGRWFPLAGGLALGLFVAAAPLLLPVADGGRHQHRAERAEENQPSETMASTSDAPNCRRCLRWQERGGRYGRNQTACSTTPEVRRGGGGQSKQAMPHRPGPKRQAQEPPR